MAKINAHGERETKGNSEDSLLVIYILSVLKKYSSPEAPISTQAVMDYLNQDYSIGVTDKNEAQKKKVRRHLETLHECYGNGCIAKIEGKTRKGHDWYYNATRDQCASEETQTRETLSDVELEFIIDLISATQLLNSESSLGMLDKLLKKTSLTEEEREQRIKAIKKEGWMKNPNDDLVEKKEIIESYFDVSRIRFNYEGNSSVLATPCGWIYSNSKCFLQAKVGGQSRQFLLEKIHDIEEADGYEDEEEYEYDYEEDLSNNTSLESLFSNIPFIKSAIKEKKGIKFDYRSYVVKNNRVVFEENPKNVLPHSLVFNDGKYYLIGIDEDAPETNKIGYFRVDLIVDLDYSSRKITLSDWNKQVYDTIQRAREVEKHPLMVAGQETVVDFLVIESALDRVRDAFGTSPIFKVTKETKLVPIDSSKQRWNENHSLSELPRENLVKFTVKTTRDEAFRWALANADAVELVYPPDLRHKLRRIATPIHNTYIKTVGDKVQENIDFIYATGMFKITMNVDESIALETFNELNRTGNTGIVDKIHVGKTDHELGDYFGSFSKARCLKIAYAPKCQNIDWAGKLTEVSRLDLIRTNVKNVSWLKAMPKLRYVEISETPISDLSVLKNHKHILYLDFSNTLVKDISFIEGYEHLGKLVINGCPIEDFSPLLKIKPLDFLKIDEKTVEMIGMDNLVKHHPDAIIEVKQKIDNRKV